MIVEQGTFLVSKRSSRMREKWTAEQAWDWYKRQPWMVGCNFTPSTAINQLEMWQADTFDPATVERELGWAEAIGFNTVRVYLHDLLWEQDAPGFVGRVDQFLNIASGKGIAPIFVIFDDCWNQDFALGKQPEPKPGVHNSGWVQSPGSRVVKDASQWGRLKVYVQGLLSVFGRDPRIRMWDLYNEPGNNNLKEQSLGLAQAVFEWAREVDPQQPLTMGIWFENEPLNAFQLEASDVISFHDYNPLDHLKRSIADLKPLGRPMVCTEYMARVRGSRFETHLPLLKAEGVGAINWGFVAGKTQTHMPWASEKDPGSEWFHEIFYPDGKSYRESEVAAIKAAAGVR
jgi:hypothetical protein